jgi:hypothetical protein
MRRLSVAGDWHAGNELGDVVKTDQGLNRNRPHGIQHPHVARVPDLAVNNWIA